MDEIKRKVTRCNDLRTANIERQKEWDEAYAITLGYRGNELAGEVGEACNIIKKMERERIGLRAGDGAGARRRLELAEEQIQPAGDDSRAGGDGEEE